MANKVNYRRVNFTVRCSPELEEGIDLSHGVDAEAEIIKMLRREIDNEINNKVIAELKEVQTFESSKELFNKLRKR